jgi:methenyltetrahydromethanopterin cyclohydrolase
LDRPYLELSYFQVALAAALVLVNGAISVLLKLELERRLFLAAACTVVQLLLVGLLLDWVFRVDRFKASCSRNEKLRAECSGVCRGGRRAAGTASVFQPDVIMLRSHVFLGTKDVDGANYGISMSLNLRALSAVDRLLSNAEECRVAVHPIEGGGRYVDCGVEVRGGFFAGIELARICLGCKGDVSIVPGELGERTTPLVQVVTDNPVQACLASQYAGWALKDGKFFAMGSGPMRAAAGIEAIYDVIGFRETASAVVGVLETRQRPPPAIVAKIASAARVEPAAVTLLAAPTASLAAGVQIVARSVETALHKLAELKFDLTRIVSAHGTAPLPPVAADDLAAIGRTNDAVLYGARVLLAVTGDDASLEAVGPMVPSSASRDYGEPFATIFARYHNDFYAVDPHLFSPAEIVFQNIETGRIHGFGYPAPDVLARSFGA